MVFFSLQGGRQKIKPKAGKWCAIKILDNLFYDSCKQWQFKQQVIIIYDWNTNFIYFRSTSHYTEQKKHMKR